MHSFASLQKDLEVLGLSRNDTVLVHSSMKSIGEVEGRADAVLDALMDYFGKTGLLVLPTLTWSNVNAEQPVFSVKHTPSVVGILPELFRPRPGYAVRCIPMIRLPLSERMPMPSSKGMKNFPRPVHAIPLGEDSMTARQKSCSSVHP